MSADRRRLLDDDRGASAVEFALIAPLLVIFLFGLFQVGWALHCASSVRYALEESARAVSIDPDLTAAEVQAAMRTRLTAFADPEFTVAIAQAPGPAGLVITELTSDYVHELAVPLLPVWDIRFQATASVVGSPPAA